MLGAVAMGIGGLLGMKRGYDAMGNLAKNQPSEDALRSTFSNSQGLIDRMTNFGQYSAPAMDMATQAGNQGVQTAMMAGMGGSQANAIRNRLRNSGVNQAYSNFNQGLGNAARLQMGIDQNIAGQLQGQRNFQNQVRMGRANAMMNIGEQLMPEGGVRNFGGLLGTGLQTLGGRFFG